MDVEHIHSGRHGSDTGVYDRNGRFSRPRFRRLFDRFDVDRDDALDGEELGRLFAGNQTDLAGHLGSRAEFGLLLGLAGQDRKGKRVLTRERLERFYNGSLFYQLAREVAAERESGGASLPGMIRTGIRTIY